MRNVSTLLRATMSLAAVFFVIFLFSMSASAATITVNSNSDAVAADGVCTLREAITAAQTDTGSDDCAAGSGADAIEFAIPACPCTITLTNGALSVLLASGGDLTINGPGAAMLTVDGGGTSGVFSTLAWGNLSINGLTVTGGNPAGISKHNDGSLNLTGVAITGNTGSGILAGFGSLSLVDSTVSNNTTAGDGAGVKTLFSSTVSITGSVIAGNSAQGSGGGVWLHEHSSLSITNSRVTGNFAGTDGGGIHKGAGLTVTDSTISGNTASALGGGIFSDQPFAGNMTIQRSTISNNGAAAGGGVYTLGHNGTGTLTLNNSTLSGNSAQQGGAVYAKVATTLLTNTTVSGNSAGGGNGVAGGIYLEGGTSAINSSTIYGNVAIFTGSILNSSGSLTINNTIVSHGDAPAGCLDINGEVTANYSLIRDPGCATVSGGNNITGVDVDAMLGPLQYNGGTTKTHALLPGSPAINAGGPTALTNDQRGLNFDRVVGTAADIGAFEVQPACAGVSFEPATAFPAGNGPLQIGKGDFNEDGDPDLVVTNYQADYLSILLGNGAGGFSAPVSYPTGEGPYGVIAADLNGDTHLDIAVANQRSDTVSILLGNGNGTFAPDVLYPAGNGPTSIVHTDLNGDGALDLATANYLSDNVTVLLGNGFGSFSPTASLPTSIRPVSLTTADFNSDGNADLATANTGVGASPIRVLYGDGAGGVMSFLNVFPAGGARWIASGDFNGDGKVDLTVASNVSKMTVLLGTGGIFGFSGYTGYGMGVPSDVVTVDDLNSDGNPDIVALNRNAEIASVWLGSGAGTFSTGGDHAVGESTSFVGTGDFNRDTKVDLVVTSGVADAIRVLINSCGSNTAPVANNDSDSVNEDSMLNRPAPGLLFNDTDSDGDPLTVVEVSGPTHGHLILGSDGSYHYTPNANFNGVDSFTYKVNDGTVDSNVATVTITVNPINDAPVVSATPETQPDVQYSDAIQTVSINASDIETLAGNLTIAFSYSKNGGASVNGLPNGMTQGGTAGAWTVSGTAGVSAGTYVITASVTDSGDGTAAAVTSADTFTIVVTRESAVAAPRVNNPVSKQVASPGGTASGTTASICFDISEIVDGSAGDTSLITSASVQISAVGGGGNGGITASPVSFSGGGVGSARVACFTLTLVNSPTNAYEVTLVIGGDYYTGSGTTAFVVFDPSAGFASGGGWITNPSTGYRANYGVNVKYLKNGNAQGSILYVEHRPDGDYKVKSTSLNSGGGFAIVPITGGSEAQIAGKANYVVNDVGTGNHSFIVRMIDRGTPGTNDAFGLKLINPSGQAVFSFDPVLLGGGNNQVPKK